MAKIDLINLEPQKISRSLKGKYVFAYGPEKIGKTSLIASFPKSLIFSFEPGTNALSGIYAQKITSWADFKLALRQLEREDVQEKFDFIGIDTIDIAYELCEAYICQQNGIQAIGDLAWGKAYGQLNKEFSKAFRTIAQLGYGLIFISHATERTLKDYNNEEYSKIMPAAPTRAKDVANKLVDFIIYIGMDFSKEYPEGRRMMYLKGNKFIHAGSRFPDVPEKIEFGYENLRDTLFDAFEAAEKRGAVLTDEDINFYEEEEKRPFKEAMKDAETIWTAILSKDDSDATADKMFAIIEEHFGQKHKLSATTEAQQELLEATIADLNELFKTLN